MHTLKACITGLIIGISGCFCSVSAAMDTIDVDGYTVHYNKELSRPLDKEYLEKFVGYSTTAVIDVKLSPNSLNYYTILFDPGPSCDPTFSVVDRQTTGNERVFGEFIATDIYIPGDGYIYASGHADTIFNHRRKFMFKDRKLEMIKQPYYFVGLDSTARRELVLYGEKDEGSPVVCVIKEGEKVHVLVSDADVDSRWFLVRNEFGLTGWVKVKSVYADESDIKGLYFEGD